MKNQIVQLTGDMKLITDDSIEPLRKRLNVTESTITELKSQLLKQGPLTSEVQSELRSLRQNCATKDNIEELRRNWAERSALNYSKKICVTTTDLDKLTCNCAMQSDIVALKEIYATKDDHRMLRQNRAMKSDMNSLKQLNLVQTDLETLRQNSGLCDLEVIKKT
jgi:hypothetical protein